VGFVAGLLSGLFGVGGGIVTTPAVNVLLGGTAIQAIATPLPVIFPTSLVGAYTYARAGEVSFRAARWAVGPGIVGAVAGAPLTERVNAHVLLLITAVIIGKLKAWTYVGLVALFSTLAGLTYGAWTDGAPLLMLGAGVLGFVTLLVTSLHLIERTRRVRA